MVVHIVPALFGDSDATIGGAERYAFELARHMAEVTPTSLVTFGERERDERVGALRVRVIGHPWHVRNQPANPFAFRLLAEVGRARVIHCHQQHILASSLAALTARLLGRRVFCTNLGGGGWDLSAYASTDRWFHGHLHISEYSRRIAGHAGQPWAHVVSGGVDTSKFSPSPGHARNGGVLFVGRILPHKGIDTLVRALPGDMPARIVGPVGDERYLADLHALSEGKQISFDHGEDDRELVDAYRSASCIVLPSVYDDMYGHHTDVPELLGQTLLEGMACGAPAVCTDVASLPEIVKNGVTGYVVPANDADALRQALLCLAGNPVRAKQLGDAARADVAGRFAWPAVVRRCLQIYGLADAPRESLS